MKHLGAYGAVKLIVLYWRAFEVNLIFYQLLFKSEIVKSRKKHKKVFKRIQNCAAAV